eukprot:665774-Rhodomonas_salina.1
MGACASASPSARSGSGEGARGAAGSGTESREQEAGCAVPEEGEGAWRDERLFARALLAASPSSSSGARL